MISLGGLERYPYAFGARAQMLAALGRHAEARAEWTAAAGCARTDAERDYFLGRAAASGAGGWGRGQRAAAESSAGYCRQRDRLHGSAKTAGSVEAAGSDTTVGEDGSGVAT